MFHFTETQKLRQWWVWLIVVLPLCTPVVLYVQQSGLFSDQPVALIFPFLFFSLVAFSLLFFMRLDTRVDHEGVHFRFIPFTKTRLFPWSEIESAYIRQYKPAKEYGGWGMRKSFKNGTAFNLRGNKGLQLVLKNGKMILLGTQKPDELQATLMSLKKG